MTLTTSTISANEQAAANRGGVMIVAKNILRNATNFQWSYDPSNERSANELSFVDVVQTDIDNPIQRVFDGRLVEPSVSLGTNAKQWALMFDLGADYAGSHDPYDFVMVKSLTDLSVWDDVEFVVSASNTFSSPNAYALTVSGARRVFANQLSDGGGSWQEVTTDGRYVKISFSGATAYSCPRVSEVIVGKRRQLSYKAHTPYAINEEQSDWSDFRARSGEITRLIHYRRKRIVQGRWTLYNHSAAGLLDDVTTAETIWEECRQGTESVIFMERAGSANPFVPVSTDVLFGKFNMTERGIVDQGPLDKEWIIDFEEQPPYANIEA